MPEPKSRDLSFSPLEPLDQALRFWWFLILLIILGGLAGFFISQLRPPVYEAVGQFSASIDYVATGPLTQYDEDVALNAIGNVIISMPVMNRVVDRAAAEGIQIDPAGLRNMTVVERRFTTWDLRVRSTDAEQARRIAEIWVEEGQAQLVESSQHAIRAEQINRYMKSLESCIGKSVSSEPSNALCAGYELAEVQAELKNAGDEFINERQASLGLFSGVTLGPETVPVLSQKPLMNGRNQLVLSGSVIGLLVGIWLFALGLPSRWWNRK